MAPGASAALRIDRRKGEQSGCQCGTRHLSRWDQRKDKGWKHVLHPEGGNASARRWGDEEGNDLVNDWGDETAWEYMHFTPVAMRKVDFRPFAATLLDTTSYPVGDVAQGILKRARRHDNKLQS